MHTLIWHQEDVDIEHNNEITINLALSNCAAISTSLRFSKIISKNLKQIKENYY